MAKLTRLRDAEVADVAKRFDLGAVSSWSPIDAGTINSNFTLSCESGRFFLRVNEGKSEEDVAYEADLVTRLAERGVPTPCPHPAGARRYAQLRDKWVSVFPWVPGRHLDRTEVEVQSAEAVGRSLGRLHRVSDEFCESLEPRHGIYTFDAVAERMGGFAATNDRRLSRALPELTEEVEWLRAQPKPADTEGIIHGDLFRDNVLFEPNGKAVAALLDFEQASLGDRTYDVAVCVNAWCYTPMQGPADEGFDPKLVAALIGGYSDVRGAVPVEALYIQLRKAAWRFTVTRITDVYLRGVDAPDKDFGRYLDRLQLWRRLGAGGLEDWMKS